MRLIKSVWKEMIKDNVAGRAAELAFFMTLSLFPLLICILSLLTFIPESRQLALRYLNEIMPLEAMDLVGKWVNEQRNPAILSFGVLLILWSASSGMAALIDVLNVVYEVPEKRSFLITRCMALFLILSLGVLVLAGCTLVIYAVALGRWLISDVGIPDLYYWVGIMGGYGGGALLLFIGLQLAYNYAPDIDRKANRAWPGSLFGTVTIILCSYLFSSYLRHGPSFSETYGSLAAIVVLMIWVYLLSLMIIIGAEINAELVKRHPRNASIGESYESKG